MNYADSRGFEDEASYVDSDDGIKRDMEGSQWGEESEWGGIKISDG
jgi:chitin synthase